MENASDDFPQQKLENLLTNFAGSSPPISPTSLWRSLVLKHHSKSRITKLVCLEYFDAMHNNPKATIHKRSVEDRFSTSLLEDFLKERCGDPQPKTRKSSTKNVDKSVLNFSYGLRLQATQAL